MTPALHNRATRERSIAYFPAASAAPASAVPL